MDYDIEQYQPQIESPKKTWLTENTKLLTAVLALIATILNMFGRSQKAMWAFGIIPGALFLGIVGKSVFARVKRVLRNRDDNKYVEREYSRLTDNFQRLRLMLNRDYSTSFGYMLFNASPTRVDVIDQICATNYLEPWVNCYSFTLQTPCGSLKDFLARCSEFTTILEQFDRNYVIKAQAAIEKSDMHSNYVDNFETFREGFVQYLRDVERWTDAIRKEALRRLPQQQFLIHLPHTFFEKPKPFRKNQTLGA